MGAVATSLANVFDFEPMAARKAAELPPLPGPRIAGDAMIDVEMPQMGESIVEGTLTRWLKKPGDRVERDEPLFEISTDKVDTEIPSPAAGVLSEVLVQEGATVAIKTIVARIGDGAAPKPRRPLRRSARRSATPLVRAAVPPPPPRRPTGSRRVRAAAAAGPQFPATAAPAGSQARRGWSLSDRTAADPGRPAAAAAPAAPPLKVGKKNMACFRRWCARWRASTMLTFRK